MNKRHERIYREAAERAHRKGWDPQLSDKADAWPDFPGFLTAETRKAQSFLDKGLVVCLRFAEKHIVSESHARRSNLSGAAQARLLQVLLCF